MQIIKIYTIIVYVEWMEKLGDFKRKHWQALFVIILLLPCLFIFGCSCSRSSDGSSSNGNVYTVIFYTGTGNEYDLPKQQIVDGGLVEKPKNFPSRYYDDATDTMMQFVGWYSDPSFASQYLWKFESDEVHSSITLYALWEQV